MFNFSARNEAMKLHNESYSTVDYTDNNEYPNCSNNGPIQTVMDGDIYKTQFNCEVSGLNSIDFVDSEIFYKITLQYDECSSPIINWSLTNDGEILDSNADYTVIIVTNAGVYTAEVLCESGGANMINEVFNIGILELKKDSHQK